MTVYLDCSRLVCEQALDCAAGAGYFLKRPRRVSSFALKNKPVLVTQASRLSLCEFGHSSRKTRAGSWTEIFSSRPPHSPDHARQITLGIVLFSSRPYYLRAW